MNNALLLSIHPEYARMIFEGTKKVELRKICPRRVASGDYVFVYVTSPIQMLIGYFEIEKIIAKEPENVAVS
ncbi:MAG: ASCH domain-containing protein [Syntrophomonadaceae bacterium]|nr:ASCH domain-containing protein [Syntrophomonadaceae bacterium]